MNKFQRNSLAAIVTLLAFHCAAAGETKSPKAVGVAVPPEASNSVSSVSTVGSGKGGGAASSSYAREAGAGESECAPAPAPAPEPSNNTGPGRISTNVTVPKQTQGASFGEKVNQGLHAAGGSLAQGAAPVGATVPGGAVISSRCAKPPEAAPMETPAATDK
jgi:hypothetical protein